MSVLKWPGGLDDNKDDHDGPDYPGLPLRKPTLNLSIDEIFSN
jgi:hypothetical protein